MTPIDLFSFGIVLFLVSAVSGLIVPGKLKGAVCSLTSGAGAVLVLASIVSGLVSGISIERMIYFSQPIGEIRFVIDPLSSFFIAVISLGAVLSAVYTPAYMKHYEKSRSAYYFFTQVLFLSMILLTTVQNVLAFLTLWEIMSISSFLLLAFENEKRDVFKAAIKYLIFMHVGFIFIAAAFILLSVFSGSMDFNSFRSVFVKYQALVPVIFLLFFAGFGMKAGFFPFHSWLPDAHTAAPVPVSAVMSGIMIKTGIYGILRILTLIGEPPMLLSYLVLALSIITAFWGIVYSLSNRDLKRVLAYSSIENIGIIGIGMGIGMLGLSYHASLITLLGFSGAFLHIFNHFLFKSLLFYGSGSVYLAAHTRDLEKLGGLSKNMPATAALFLTGAAAISALPPLNGFWSELLIYLGILQGIHAGSGVLSLVSVVSLCALSLIGALVLYSFARAYSVAFSGHPRSPEAANAKEQGPLFILPMIVLAALIAAVGLFPQTVFRFLSALTAGIFIQGPLPELKQTSSVVAMTSYLSYGLIFLFLAIFVWRYIRMPDRKVRSADTWSCGYRYTDSREIPKLQYTAASFSESLLGLFRYFVVRKITLQKPEGLFPEQGSFEMKTREGADKWLYNPLAKSLAAFMDRFVWMQSGSTRRYVLYGIITLILAMIWVLGVQK